MSDTAENSTIVNEPPDPVLDTNGLLVLIHKELVEMNETLETNTNLIRDAVRYLEDLAQMMSRR